MWFQMDCINHFAEVTMTWSQETTYQDQQSSVGNQWWRAWVQILGTSVAIRFFFFLSFKLNSRLQSWWIRLCLLWGRGCRFVDFGLQLYNCSSPDAGGGANRFPRSVMKPVLETLAQDSQLLYYIKGEMQSSKGEMQSSTKWFLSSYIATTSKMDIYGFLIHHSLITMSAVQMETLLFMMILNSSWDFC